MAHQAVVANACNELNRKVRFILSVAIFGVVCFAVTALQWFGVQDYSVLAPKQGYAASVQVVRAATAPFSGDNLLWYGSEITYCDQVIAIPKGSSAVSVIVSTLSNSDFAMIYGYRASLIDENGTETLTDEDFTSSPLAPGSSVALGVAVDSNQYQSIRLQVYTAPQGEKLRAYPRHKETADTIENWKGVTYLTDDVTLQEPLTIRNANGILCLCGHTLCIPTLNIESDAGCYGVLTVTDGTLIINGKKVTDQVPATFSGEGNTVLKLQNITE